MSRNYLRRCHVRLAGGAGRTISGGRDNELRIAFRIERSTLQSPNSGQIRIYNPAPATIAQFQNKEFQTVELTAGYEGNEGLIYKGDIKQSIYRKEDAVTSYIAMFCATFDVPYNRGRMSSTLAAGHTPQDRVDAALKAMAPFGIPPALALVNVDLSQPRFPRGFPMSGMARDVLRGVALSAGALWSMQNDGVHIINQRKPATGSPPIFVMNSATGMLGMPEQTEDGVIVRSLINSRLAVNSLVKIDQKSIQQAEPDYATQTSDVSMTNFNLQNTGLIAADGLYRVIFISTEGDTRGEEWSDTSTVIALHGGNLNAAEAQSSPYPGLTLGRS